MTELYSKIGRIQCNSAFYCVIHNGMSLPLPHSNFLWCLGLCLCLESSCLSLGLGLGVIESEAL